MTSSHQCSLQWPWLRLGQLLFLISPTWKGFWSSIGSLHAYYFFRRTAGWFWGTERWANIQQQRLDGNFSGGWGREGGRQRTQRQVRGAAFVLVASNGKVRRGVQQAVRSTSDGHLVGDQGLSLVCVTLALCGCCPPCCFCPARYATGNNTARENGHTQMGRRRHASAWLSCENRNVSQEVIVSHVTAAAQDHMRASGGGV